MKKILFTLITVFAIFCNSYAKDYKLHGNTEAKLYGSFSAELYYNIKLGYYIKFETNNPDSFTYINFMLGSTAEEAVITIDKLKKYSSDFYSKI